MTEARDRAWDWLADAKRAHVYGVATRFDATALSMWLEVLHEFDRVSANLAGQGARVRDWRDTHKDILTPKELLELDDILLMGEELSDD